MLGAPGAGKGTQAKRIAEEYAIPHVSTGDIFRANIKEGTELGVKAKSYIDSGNLVPDEVTIAMLLDRIHDEDCKEGFVLDGFPRTIAQAVSLGEALDKSGEKIDFAVEVDDGGAGLFGISHTACGHKPAVQGCAVGALEGDVFVGQAGLGGRAVVGMVGIVKGLFGAGGQAEQNGEEGG